MAPALVNLLPFLAILAFYLLVIRPGRARARAQVAMQHSLAVGQEVMTTSGLLGTVAGIGVDVALLEVAPGVTVRFTKGAIARVVTPTDVPPAISDDVDDDSDTAPGGTVARSE